jgi:hypothetical protein
VLSRALAEADGWSNGLDDGEWWVIWPLERLVTENLQAWDAEMLARELLAFGDDGTGNPFCLSLLTDSDEVVRWNWIDHAVEVEEGPFDRWRHDWCRGSGSDDS